MLTSCPEPTLIGTSAGARNRIVQSHTARSAAYRYDRRGVPSPAIEIGRPASTSPIKLPIAKCASSGRCGPQKAQQRAIFASNSTPFARARLSAAPRTSAPLRACLRRTHSPASGGAPIASPAHASISARLCVHTPRPSWSAETSAPRTGPRNCSVRSVPARIVDSISSGSPPPASRSPQSPRESHIGTRPPEIQTPAHRPRAASPPDRLARCGHFAQTSPDRATAPSPAHPAPARGSRGRSSPPASTRRTPSRR